MKNNDISVESVLLERGQMLPFQDNSIDYIVTFYSLGHIDPIDDYLVELKRVLKVGVKLWVRFLQKVALHVEWEDI